MEKIKKTRIIYFATVFIFSLLNSCVEEQNGKQPQIVNWIADPYEIMRPHSKRIFSRDKFYKEKLKNLSIQDKELRLPELINTINENLQLSNAGFVMRVLNPVSTEYLIQTDFWNGLRQTKMLGNNAISENWIAKRQFLSEATIIEIVSAICAIYQFHVFDYDETVYFMQGENLLLGGVSVFDCLNRPDSFITNKSLPSK